MKNSGNEKDDEIKLKDERIRLKLCDDLDGGSDEMAEEIWTPEKKRWKHLELEFIPQEQTLRKGLLDDEEVRIRITLCYPHQIKLMTSNGFGMEFILVEKD